MHTTNPPYTLPYVDVRRSPHSLMCVCSHIPLRIPVERDSFIFTKIMDHCHKC